MTQVPTLIRSYLSTRDHSDYWQATADYLSQQVISDLRQNKTTSQEVSDAQQNLLGASSISDLQPILSQLLHTVLVARSQGIEAVTTTALVESILQSNQTLSNADIDAAIDSLRRAAVISPGVELLADLSMNRRLLQTNRPFFEFSHCYLSLQNTASRCAQLCRLIESRLLRSTHQDMTNSSDLSAADNPSDAIVARMVKQPLALLTGGPGTGKTTTAVKIIRAYLALGIPASRIALCAPTGKAVQRLGESVRLQMSNDRKAEALTFATLHRLLQLKTPLAEIKAHPFEPLARYQLVIVDEASMLDYELMQALLSQLSQDTYLILMGDANQLGPIGLGRPFQSLIAALPDSPLMKEGNIKTSPVFTLTKSYRFDENSSIGEIARLALANDSKTLINQLQMGDRLYALTNLEQQLQRHYQAYRDLIHDPSTRIETLLEASLEVKCLTSHNDGPEGSAEINAWLDSWMQPDKPHRSDKQSQAIYHGQILMMTWNDYQNDLYNGDMGVCIQEQNQYYLALPASSGTSASSKAYRYLPMIELTGLVPAYAITIHKSQGSEYEQVLIVLSDVASEHTQTDASNPTADRFAIMNRAMLYTAITRAKTGLAFCASKASIAHCSETLNAGPAVLEFMLTRS